MNTEELKSKIAFEKEIYEELSKELSKDAIQRAKKEDTHKSYDQTGIGYQFCVNRFNEVLGFSWGYVWEISSSEKGEWGKSAIPCYTICIKLGIWVLEKDNIRWAVGGHTSSSLADAEKGALTNAFKKTAGFFGVGRQAYEGVLDEDMQKREHGEEDIHSPVPTSQSSQYITKGELGSIENLRKNKAILLVTFKQWLLSTYKIAHRNEIPKSLYLAVCQALREGKMAADYSALVCPNCNSPVEKSGEGYVVCTNDNCNWGDMVEKAKRKEV